MDIALLFHFALRHLLHGNAFFGISHLPGFGINIPTLPAGLKVNGVSVTSQGVVLTAAARNTTLSQ